MYEMARLARHLGGRDVPKDDAGRIDLCGAAAREFGCVVLLKGQRTVISDGERYRLNTTGDNSLAKAGSGDTSGNVVSWTVSQSSVGMGIGGSEIPASLFQAANPVFIILFGLAFTWLWSWLGASGREPKTPVKFALGLLQLGLGFGVLWYGAQAADPRGMVNVTWLLLGYLLHTTGELCISPVGLSMVTKLSPSRIVSTVMGAWFLATAFSNFLAGLIAQLTGVGEEGAATQVVPPPRDTVHLYGDVFGQIALIAIASAVVCFALSPLLSKWMHAELEEN